MNQLNDYEISCQKCGKKFTLKLTESQYIKNKYRKHCSRSCANSRTFSNESIEKKRIAALNNKKTNRCKYNYKNYTCKYCGKSFTVIEDRDLTSRKYCSKKCKDSYYNEYIKPKQGGYRKGSGRSIHGYYKGIRCDSSYELAFLIYCLDHNINIRRCDKTYKYIYDNKEHLYFPDFIINNTIIEIKGYHTDVVDIKSESIRDFDLVVLYKSDLKVCFDYIKDKYNVSQHNIFEMYDDFKPQYEYVCTNCGKKFHKNKKINTFNKFCSRSCAGKYNTKMKIFTFSKRTN